jgi:hypothetical protein
MYSVMPAAAPLSVAPLQAAFHAAPVLTRNQRADVAKDSFRQGAQDIIRNFVVQVLPGASRTLDVGPELLQRLSVFIQHHFQGVTAE